MSDIELEIIPREPFREFIGCKNRYMTLVCHRRAGKTVASIQKLIYEALTHERAGTKTAPLRYGYLAPTLTQAKLIAWSYAKEFTADIPGIKVNESELKITFPNRAELRLYGSERAETLRGIYFDGLLVDEADDVESNTISYILMPCLLDYSGFLCL